MVRSFILILLPFSPTQRASKARTKMKIKGNPKFGEAKYKVKSRKVFCFEQISALSVIVSEYVSNTRLKINGCSHLENKN